MNALVVYAHPTEQPLGNAVLETAVGSLEIAGHAVRVVDLYGEEFEPRMTTAERMAYQTNEPIVSDDVACHVEYVSWAEALVFVYPTWCGGLPAILKGWLDRIMLPGVAFRFSEGSLRVRPALDRVRRVVGVATTDSSWVDTRLRADAGRRIITRGLRLGTCPWARTSWVALHRSSTATEAQRKDFLMRVRSTLGRI